MSFCLSTCNSLTESAPTPFDSFFLGFGFISAFFLDTAATFPALEADFLEAKALAFCLDSLVTFAPFALIVIFLGCGASSYFLAIAGQPI